MHAPNALASALRPKVLSAAEGVDDADLLKPTLLAAARAESVAICRGDRGEIDGVTRAGKREADNSVLRATCASTSLIRSRRWRDTSHGSRRSSTN
jgi:hypothetical protein